ncbi:MAG: DUF1569 domain-containing protein [Flammeovirgaceae bacterium]
MMTRKEFMLKSAQAGIVIASLPIVSSCIDNVKKLRADLRFKNLAEAMKDLEKIEQSVSLKVNGEWSIFQNLIHCAQSIEYSLTGYPEHRSWLFKNTIGAIAFSTFERRGYMTHDLSAPIPQAPEILKEGDLKEAVQRLKKAIEDFDNFSGNLAEHFAYGQLTKEEYALAHTLHLADHLSVIAY